MSTEIPRINEYGNKKNLDIIDAHCHVGAGRFKRQSPELLIKQMDACGVAKSVISPVDEFVSVNNREGNDYIISEITKCPDRIVGFAVANPWFGDDAVEELKRAQGCGLKGLKVNSFLQGFLLNDSLMYPLIEVCRESGLPVYFHTGTPVCAMPFQLRNIAERFPDVNFIMGHSGFADFWYDAIPAATGLDNIFLETSFIDIGIIGEAVNKLGEDRVVFGSDSPVSDLSLEIYKIEASGLSRSAKRKIFCENIKKLVPGI